MGLSRRFWADLLIARARKRPEVLSNIAFGPNSIPFEIRIYALLFLIADNRNPDAETLAKIGPMIAESKSWLESELKRSSRDGAALFDNIQHNALTRDSILRLYSFAPLLLMQKRYEISPETISAMAKRLTVLVTITTTTTVIPLTYLEHRGFQVRPMKFIGWWPLPFMRTCTTC